MQDSQNTREFELVLFGATGFTGQLVAEYLAENAPDLTWALAGRNLQKLESVRARLHQIRPELGALPLIEVDAADTSALRRLAPRTRVVVTTVGPYARHGMPLVAACAELGTHYCDLTGEVTFMRRSIDAWHHAAQKSGARIVHACGFDSIPSDLGTWMLVDEARRRGLTLNEVRCYAGESRGGVSGGTVASMLQLIEEASRDKALRRLLANPNALCPDPAAAGVAPRDQVGVRHDDELGMWTAPFVMAQVNSRVVRRSSVLADYCKGSVLRYSECASTGKGPAGLMRATALTAALGGFLGAVSQPALRKLLAAKVLPKPGEGPSEEKRKAGFFVTRLLGLATGADGTAVKLRARVEGKQDPGYGETAKMLSQAALCLARDGALTPQVSGVITPAVAFGGVLVDRLRAAGMVLSLEK
jgi:short subunit dehydrogenase-like uncharacterized protein